MVTVSVSGIVDSVAVTQTDDTTSELFTAVRIWVEGITGQQDLVTIHLPDNVAAWMNAAEQLIAAGNDLKRLARRAMGQAVGQVGEVSS